METINHILTSFDLTSIFSALFPAIAKSFEKCFILIYESVFTRIIEVFEKIPFLLPAAVFIGFYFIAATLISRKKLVRIRK